MPLPLLTAQRITAAKIEATYATAETLTATEGAMNIFDTEIKPQSEINPRPGQSSFSQLPGVPGKIYNKSTFKSELFGGATAPYWTALLQACGLGFSSLTFTPQTGSATAASLTLGLYQDGKRRTSSGCMGNFTLKGETGKPAVFEWDFMGLYVPPTDTALITPTYPTVIPPNVEGVTLTIGGSAFTWETFELSPNNVVQMRPSGSASYGYAGAIIVKRGWKLKLDPEDVLLATKDWDADYIAGTTAALSIVIGAAANNTITITAPKLQLAKPTDPADKNGYQVNNLEFDLVKSAAAGDDEISIVFS